MLDPTALGPAQTWAFLRPSHLFPPLLSLLFSLSFVVSLSESAWLSAFCRKPCIFICVFCHKLVLSSESAWSLSSFLSLSQVPPSPPSAPGLPILFSISVRGSRTKSRREEKRRNEVQKKPKSNAFVEVLLLFYHVLYVSSKDMQRHAIFHADMQFFNVLQGTTRTVARERLDWRLQKV